MKRLISVMILIVSLLCLTVTAYASDQQTGGGMQGGGAVGDGAWSSDKSGYRIYITDQQCNLISNIVDFVRQTPSLGSNVAVCIGTKKDGLASASSISEGKSKPWSYQVISDLGDSKLNKSSYWAKSAYQSSSGSWKGDGGMLVAWMAGPSAKEDGTTSTQGGSAEGAEADGKVADTYKLPNFWGNKVSTSEIEEKSSLLNIIIDDLTAYAVTDVNAENGAICAIVDYNGGGGPIFVFGNGVKLSEAKDKNGNPYESVMQTCRDNNYKIWIEPVFWYQPQNLDLKLYKTWFYGTVTDYGKWMHGECGNWDGGAGGNYCNCINKIAVNSPYTGVDITDATKPYLKGNTKVVGITDFNHSHTSVSLKNQHIGKETFETTQGKGTENACSGGGLHAHALSVVWCASASNIPEIPTYDTPKKNEHPAPDPTPTNIPLVPGEKEPPGDPKIPPVDPEEPQPDPGHQNHTRVVSIIKVYDIEHMDGTIEHVTTTYRQNCPPIVHVQHEPEYKVVGYYSSPVDSGHPDRGGMADFGESTEWQPMKEYVSSYSSEFKTIKQEKDPIDYDSVKSKEAGTTEETLKVAIACKPPEDDRLNDPSAYDDTSYNDICVYVHLLKKEKIPETSTFDEPDNPPSGVPPVVPPHAPDDPFDPDVNDPETTPVEEGNPYAHYRIVKVYDTITEKEDGTEELTTDAIFHRFPTNPVVYIQEEAQSSDPYDGSWHLLEWQYGPEYNGVPYNDSYDKPNGTDWESVVSGVSAKGSGTTVDKVDLIDKDNKEKVVTLYVRLQRRIKENNPVGAIIIQQSQISKTIHTNDANIGGKFGNYKFKMTIGDFTPSHTTYFDHCCRPGEHKYHSCGCDGHTCKLEMPGADGDNEVTFVFDLISAQDDLEIKPGVHAKTDPKIYGDGGAPHNLGTGVSYDETVPSMKASGNKKSYTSDGNDSNGAEYVTVLWRCSDKVKDIPTLAKFKKKDIEERYGTENYEIPDKMLSSIGSTASKKSNRKRASQAWVGDYKIEFGLDEGKSDIQATASCVGVPGLGFGSTCIFKDTQDYYPIEGTTFTYNFDASVAVRFYAGEVKTLQAQPFGGKVTAPKTTPTGKHSELTVIQGKQEIRFFPYIRMTYMINELEAAIKEEENTDANGAVYKEKDKVRYSTYVLSEWESSVLPSDAINVAWKNNRENESLLLTSQQWSLHQKAISGSDVWQGRNQVLPGGAIYQLSTPDDRLTEVMITTYQTVVDEKARSEYLSNTLSGDEYTEAKVAKDHKDFVNQAKTVLDNLKIVQWVNKNVGSNTAWPSNFDDTNTSDGAICLRGLGESLNELGENRSGMRDKANTDEKYYMRQQEMLSSFISPEQGLGKWSYDVSPAKNRTDGKGEKPTEGDMDIWDVEGTLVVYKLFADTSGNIYWAKGERKYTLNNVPDDCTADIQSIVNSMKDLNGDTYAMGKTPSGISVELLCDKKVAANLAASGNSEAQEIDTRTSFVTNFVGALTRNKGADYTAEWANKPDGMWYNEAFDGVYMVKQYTKFKMGLKISPLRTSALDPALCPKNVGQSDLFTKAFLSQFCLDKRSDADIAKDKADHYIGTFKGVDIKMPDMESMYISKKFYIPNANVQDLN